MDINPIGKLYICATPIGNLGDITPRVVDTLKEVDLIAAEDTRNSLKILNRFGISTPMTSYHEHNKYEKAEELILKLKEGQNIAVITDAGTPCISDPGNELIKAAIEAGIRVVGIPGCCAAVNALSVCGFDLTSFMFYGFFPRENADRKRMIEKMRRGDTKTFVLYESPKRIMELVDFFIDIGAKCRMCLCNDMTKLHEMTFRGTPSEVRDALLAKGNYEKGEYVTVVEIDDEYIFNKVEHTVSAEAMLVDAMLSGGVSPKEAVAAVLADENNSYSKNELKAAALNLKRMFGE